jgi:hypothetical protein
VNERVHSPTPQCFGFDWTKIVGQGFNFLSPPNIFFSFDKGHVRIVTALV